MIGVFNGFWISQASFTVAGSQMTLAVDMKIKWRINLRLTIDLTMLKDIFNGNFYNLARSALGKLLTTLNSWNPCNCAGGAKAPMESTWGAYYKSYRGYSVPFCGVSRGYYRSCGHSFTCGVNVRWCS